MPPLKDTTEVAFEEDAVVGASKLEFAFGAGEIMLLSLIVPLDKFVFMNPILLAALDILGSGVGWIGWSFRYRDMAIAQYSSLAVSYTHLDVYKRQVFWCPYYGMHSFLIRVQIFSYTKIGQDNPSAWLRRA